MALCDVPTGREGRQSKSLTFDQAETLLRAAEGSPLHAYIVLSLLIGARTEELRALRWRRRRPRWPAGRESAGHTGDRRLPIGTGERRHENREVASPACAAQRCVEALRRQLNELSRPPAPDDLVFATANGTGAGRGHVRRSVRRIVEAAGLDSAEWTPRKLRRSFVSLPSASGVRIEDISRLVGHSGSRVTEKVYRHQLHAVLDVGPP